MAGTGGVKTQILDAQQILHHRIGVSRRVAQIIISQQPALASQEEGVTSDVCIRLLELEKKCNSLNDSPGAFYPLLGAVNNWCMVFQQHPAVLRELLFLFPNVKEFITTSLRILEANRPLLLAALGVEPLAAVISGQSVPGSSHTDAAPSPAGDQSSSAPNPPEAQEPPSSPPE